MIQTMEICQKDAPNTIENYKLRYIFLNSKNKLRSYERTIYTRMKKSEKR